MLKILHGTIDANKEPKEPRRENHTNSSYMLFLDIVERIFVYENLGPLNVVLASKLLNFTKGTVK